MGPSQWLAEGEHEAVDVLDRMATVANLDQTADIGMHPFGGYPTSWRLIERFSLDKREVG